jgi:hypothetical protein
MNRALVRQYTLGRIIKTSYGLFYRHFRQLFGGAIIVMAPWCIFDWYISHSTPEGGVAVVLQLLSFFVMQLAMPLLLLQVNDVVRGLRPSLSRSLRIYTSDRIWPFIATYFVVTILIWLGFILLVIPGIIASAIFLFAMIVAIIEGKGPGYAMKKSRELGKGCYVRNICVLYASWFAVSAPVFMLLVIAATGLGLALETVLPAVAEAPMLFELLGMFLGAAIVPAIVLPQILLYYDMRARKEGLDDNRFVEELRLTGLDGARMKTEGKAWTPAQS